jgi:nucleoside-diphosphate-sugar epimerase
MKIFVAGASGAIGRPLVRQLVAAGHEVTGMTRRQEKAEEIRATGAAAVVCDAFDAEALNRAVAAAAPEAVVHVLTALPPKFNPRSDYLTATNRVRIEGTRNLVAAAKAAGARRIVAESVAFFYEPEGDWIKDEQAPLFVDPPGRFAAARDAIAELESTVTGADGLEGIVLRFGWFYGPGTYYDTGGSMAVETLKRRNPIVGAGTGTFSFIHIDDAAAAVAAALDRVPPAHTTSSMTSRPSCVTGCRSTPRRSAPSSHAESPPGWRGCWRDRTLRAQRWRCAAPPTPRRSASWAGSRPTRAGARAFATRSPSRPTAASSTT